MVIDPQRVKRAVYNRIDFELPEETWKEINDAFCTCWNEVIGFGNEVDSIEVKNYIADWLRKRQILLLENRLVHISDIMFDYIKMVGGFLNESRPFLPKRMTHQKGENKRENQYLNTQKTILTEKQLEVIRKIESQPCQTLSQKKLSLKEMRKQFQENNPKGFRGFNQAEPENIKGQETKQSKP